MKTKTGRKQSSDALSKLASEILAGRRTPTPAEIRRLAASVLAQDETKGRRARAK